MPSICLICLARNPKRVIVQWVGIGTHTHTHTHTHLVKCIVTLFFTVKVGSSRVPFACHPQHGSWQWQLRSRLANLKQYLRSTAAYNWVKLQREIKNHAPYNMRCWKCCPPSSTHFWHLFRKCAFTWINWISEIQSISCLILAFNSSNVWGVCNFYLWGHLKNKVYATNPHTLEELKASIRCEIDCIPEIEIMRVNAHFLKDARNVWIKEDNISIISCYKVCDYFSL